MDCLPQPRKMNVVTGLKPGFAILMGPRGRGDLVVSEHRVRLVGLLERFDLFLREVDLEGGH